LGEVWKCAIFIANGDGAADKLEIMVLMEDDDDHSSVGEDGLARCACKQAAGMLEEYKEDGQQLPGDEDYEVKEDEDGLTSKEVDIIHDAEQLV
jgi:hypothetical protein